MPRFAEVVRALDDHGLGPERLELHDEMGEVELGLEIELDLDVLHAVLGLPPGEPAVPDRDGDTHSGDTGHTARWLAQRTLVGTYLNSRGRKS